MSPRPLPHERFDRPPRPRTPRWLAIAPLVLLGLLVLSMLFPSHVPAQGFYDRNEVPGNYTIGFYPDVKGDTRELRLPKGEDRFEAFIGITGDSTRVFSGLVFRMELPDGVEFDGPIVWRPLEGLRQYDPVETRGTRVNFPQACVEAKGSAPVMVGRIPLRLSPQVKQAVIEPLAHLDFGLSVELCQPDRSFPKPYAKGLPLTVKRQQSVWDRITSLFE